MKTITQLTKNKIIDAFKEAEQDKSGLREFERDLYGASGRKTRHAINNICGVKDNLTYLELGVYRGSTLVAANYDNKLTTYAIDDFTIDIKEPKQYKENGWNNARQATKDLLDRYNFSNVNIIEEEANSVDTKKIAKKVDIVHYDLDEHHASVEQVLRHYLSVFDKHTILMFSNWNSNGVRNSFAQFKKTPGIEVEMLFEKLSSATADSLNWYNGFAVFLFTLNAKEVEKEVKND